MSLLKKKPAAKKAPTAQGALIANARLYDVIRRPVITEKSTAAAEQNKVTFAITPDATKADVKAAVEAVFKVTVTKVNTIHINGKTKRFRGRPGQRNDIRKAIVTLAAGQSIDFAAGAK
jgi:large subunit ribosomal protein L23